MKEYNPVTAEVIDALKAVVGDKYVKTDADVLDIYKSDESLAPSFWKTPEVVVLPANTQEVSEIMKIANRFDVPVTPRSAGTSVSCGAVPAYKGIVLLMERMNHIIELNEDGMYMTVEAGVRTIDIQNAARKKGLLYAGDPCSSDSCLIGGNLATNAGGNKAVRYGTTRHQVYSVEVVNPTGRIVNLGARLQKQSTGYSLDQLVIGSEGTLGIITKATLKLLPKPKYALDLLAIFDDRRQAMGVVTKIIKAGITPTCVEFMDNITIKSVEKYLNENLQGSDNGNYVIVEVEGTSEDDLDDKAVILDEVCTENGASSVLVADHNKIWQARKAFAEAVRAESLIVCKEDVVVPVDQEAALLDEILRLAKKYNLVTRIASHAGDGNIHLNILKNEDATYEDWDQRVKANQQELYKFIYAHGGRLSGEHGIGYKRKHLMEEFTDPGELEMMKAIKKALDPNDILNPGKIFDVD